MEDLAKVEFFKRMFKQGKNIWVKITGNSMWPFLKDGQVVMVSPTDTKNISVGDIVLGYIAGRVVCHRVFRRKADLLQTKGDGLARLDALIGNNELIGKIVAKQAKGKILRTDGLVSSYSGFLISRLSLITAHCYPALRFLKKAFLNSIVKALIRR